MRNLWLILFTLQYYHGIGQISFEEKAGNYFGDRTFTSTLTIGITDVDGDNMDDVIFLDKGIYLTVGLYKGEGDVMEFIQLPIPVAGNPEWSFAVGDLDNDGISEFITTGVHNKIKVYQLDLDLKEIQLKQKLTSGAYGQASNILDINGDGWNDYFLCSDDGMSKLFLNDGTGSLVSNNNMFDFSTDPASDFSGNYGSDWADIDDDGLPELYIAKCKAGVTDSADPRRVNQFFKIDEDGVYRDIAKEIGLNLGDQSWATVMSDLDNDGYLDVIVANHNTPHTILKNQDGLFTPIQYSEDGLTSFAFQVMTADFDNDGLLDILFTGDKDYLFHNLGDFNFDIREDLLGYYDIISAALGDINMDGFVDVITSYGRPLLEVGNRPDGLWINNDNGNNYVCFSLTGVQSNTKGLGAKVKIYGTWGVQQRTIRGGQSYGIVNSSNANFGLGDQEIVDSVSVQWPGGATEMHYNVAGGMQYLLTQGGCISPMVDFRGINLSFCEEEGLYFDIGLNYQNVSWSNGDMGWVVALTQTENVSARGLDDKGCPFYSSYLVAETIDLLEYSLPYGDTLMLCSGDFIVAELNNVDFIQWSDGSNNTQIIPESSGLYGITVTGNCGNTFTDSVEIVIRDPMITAIKDTVEKGRSALLEIEGEMIKWYENEMDVEPIFVGNEFQTPTLEETTIYYAENTITNSEELAMVGAIRLEEDSPYASDNTNSALRFDVEKSLILQEISCYTDRAGVRSVLILDNEDNIIFSHLVELSEGENTLYVNTIISPGIDYIITTDAMINMENLGFNGPRLERRSVDVFYPYIIADVIEIHGSTTGSNYYYFFDWKIKAIESVCTSERVAAEIYVDFGSGINDDNTKTIFIQPNPVIDILKVFSNEIIKGKIMMYNIHGQLQIIKNISSNEVKLSVDHIQSGVYIIVILDGEETFSKCVVKL